MNFYLFIEVKKGGGVALVHVYLLEHIVSLNYINYLMDIYQTW